MLLKVIEFHDPTNQTLIQRIPPHGAGEIPMGSQLLVQQNQEAVFFRNGEAHDVLGPGRHILNTDTIPILTRMLTIPWQRSPVSAHVIFVGRQTFLDQRWGTRQPIMMRDRELGVVRIRGFGKYAFRAVDSALLVNTLVGTQGKVTTEDVTSFLRDVVVTRLSDLLGTLQVSLLDLASNLDELSAATRVAVASDFTKYGLELTDLFINSLTAPEDVQRSIDARSGMAITRDLGAYTQYQAGTSLREMARTGGGGGGMGVGVGTAVPWLIEKGSGAAESPASSDDRAVSEVVQAEVLDARDLVRRVARAAGWHLTESADAWRLTVALGPLRRQTIFVRFNRRDDDNLEVMNFATYCGPATAENALNYLRQNSNLVHGAFAARDTQSGLMVTLESNHLVDTADPLEVARAVAAIAWQADRVEQQLVEHDEF